MVIRHALLALLSEGPKHGFQLAQEFEARTGEVWPLNTGQVYTTLQRLERDELVESDDTVENGAQNRYRLTEAGREELDSWLHSPPDTASPPRDELVIKVLVALRVPDVDVDRADPDLPPARNPGHARVHTAEGGRARGRHEPPARCRRGDLPARCRRPLARRRRGSDQAHAGSASRRRRLPVPRLARRKVGARR